MASGMSIASTSVCAAAITAVGMYAALRLAQAALGANVNPAHVLWSDHAAFFWRALTAAYAAMTAAFVAAWSAIARMHRPSDPGDCGTSPLAKYLSRALTLAVALLVIQATIAP